VPEHVLRKITENKSHLFCQVAPRPEKEVETPVAASFKPDMLSQVFCRLGGLSGAGAPASGLRHGTSLPPLQRADSLLNLQRTYGNRYVLRLMALDRQADGEAEMNPEVDDAIQAKRSSRQVIDTSGEVPPELETTINRTRGGGHALDSLVRRQMESAFGADFSGVRVHTGTEADTLNQTLNARAFTTGNDIFFRQGEYSPGSSGGRELLAHELTHVVQQHGGLQHNLKIGQPGDMYEREADKVAQSIIQQERQVTTLERTQGRLQRQGEEKEEEESVQTKAEHSLSQGKVEGEEEEEFIQTKGKDLSVVQQRSNGIREKLIIGEKDDQHGQETVRLAKETMGQKQIVVNRIDNKQVRCQEAIEVEIVLKSELSVPELIEDNLNTQEAILENERTALDNFETVVTHASKKESIPKGAGEIVIEELNKYVIKKIIDIGLKEFPVAKEIIDIGTSIIESVEKEKQRAAEASVSNALGKFIVSQRTQIGKMISRLKSLHTNIKHDAQTRYEKKSPGEKESYRIKLSYLNNQLTTMESSSHSPEALFKLISEKWIGGVKGHVFIRLDKNWNVLVAHIHAPRGQRLAEALLRAGGGKVNLNDLKVKRTVEFMPEKLTWVWANYDENGKMVGGIRFNIFGQKYVKKYIENIRKSGLPETAILSGK
jgi:hypothetical protein